MPPNYPELLYGCSWYPHRINVVPFGWQTARMPAETVDDLATARSIKAKMLADGADEVRIYDTVEGKFYD